DEQQPLARARRGHRSGTEKRLEAATGQALLTDRNGTRAVWAADHASCRQGGEDHVFKGLALGETEPGPFVDHAIQDFAVRGLGRGNEVTGAAATAQFDLHEPSPCSDVTK